MKLFLKTAVFFIKVFRPKKLLLNSISDKQKNLTIKRFLFCTFATNFLLKLNQKNYVKNSCCFWYCRGFKTTGN